MMKWLGIIRGRRATVSEDGARHKSLSELAAADPDNRVTLRDARIVRDVARHVASKVVPIVELHGRSMENALQANVMAIEVALHLALEAAQRAALTAVVQGATLEDALAKLDAALLTIAEGLGDHRPALAAAIEAAHAGVGRGAIRQ